MGDDRGGVAARYAIEATLGKGGMGVVYRALDRQTGRHVALKRMLATEHKQERLRAFFEREYRTLCQLAHPSVIEVYEYGLTDGLPYYTMELLDGEDLSARTPLEARDACALLHDVASSLALLHARGFVHRDVTARNIRVVAPDRAKLLDFGAIAPMGPSDDVTGTPLYVPPEAVLGQRLDGRADLYALGVVLYNALTKRFPYSVRALRELRAAWQRPPAPVAQLVPGIQPELAGLTMSLLSLDRSARPRSAAEVMERLAVLGGLDRAEPPSAARAYLVTPAFEGRSECQRDVRGRLMAAIRGRGGALAFVGAPGMGRTRAIDAGVLEAKVMGVTVLRVGARHCHGRAFDAARALVDQLIAADAEVALDAARAHWPACRVLFVEEEADACTPADLAGKPRGETLAALEQWLLAFATRRPLLVAADDLPALDEPSLALLATLASKARKRRLLVLATFGDGSVEDGPLSLRLLFEQCERVPLSPLDERATRRVLAGVFGEVPNLGVVAAQIHRLSGGRPREIMALAEHLVDRGLVEYAAGRWLLPQSLDAESMPGSLVDALAERLARLSAGALWLARRQALSPLRCLALDELGRLAGADASLDVYAAADELVMRDVVVAGVDGYTLAHEGWVTALASGLPSAERERCHLDLADMHERGGADQLLVAYHLLLGGDRARALEVLDAYCSAYTLQTADVFGTTRLDARALGVLFAEARAAASAVDVGLALRTRLAQFMLAAGTLVEPRWFFEVSGEVERELRANSGHDHWQTLDPSLPARDRVLAALQHAVAAHEGTPEAERGPHPVQALQSLAQFSVASLAVSLSTCDYARLRGLPDLLEPFTPLSPVLETLLKNLYAVIETVNGDYERSRELYLEVLERLADVDVATLEHADEIRAGVTFGTAVVESRMGMLDSAAQRLEVLKDNQSMGGNVLGLRAILAMSRGDWAGARALRQRARQLGVQREAAPLFGQDHLPAEVELCALGLDIDALKPLLAEIERLAERYPGWQVVYGMAQADLARLRGDPQGALAHVDRCLARCGGDEAGPPSSPWHHAASTRLELLAELGRAEEAVAWGCELVAEGQHPGRRHHRVLRALALAEARAGHHDAAGERLAALLDRMAGWGATGVELGLLHEALAWCALWRGDRPGFREHATRTAGAYHQVDDSGFAARYQRLRQAIRSSELVSDIPPPQSVEHASSMASTQLELVSSRVRSELDLCSERSHRAERGLALLCELAGARSGFLYLLDAEGLVHVATLPGSVAGPGLDEFAQQALTSEIQLNDQPTLTSMLTGHVGELGAAPRPWLGAEGAAHHVLRIRARLAAEGALVGVAVLEAADPFGWAPEAIECAAALGDRFVQVGDASTAVTTLH